MLITHPRVRQLSSLAPMGALRSANHLEPYLKLSWYVSEPTVELTTDLIYSASLSESMLRLTNFVHIWKPSTQLLASALQHIESQASDTRKSMPIQSMASTNLILQNDRIFTAHQTFPDVCISRRCGGSNWFWIKHDMVWLRDTHKLTEQAGSIDFISVCVFNLCSLRGCFLDVETERFYLFHWLITPVHPVVIRFDDNQRSQIISFSFKQVASISENLTGRVAAGFYKASNSLDWLQLHGSYLSWQ